MPKKYVHVLSYFNSRIFAITEEKLAEVQQFMYKKGGLIQIDESEIEAHISKPEAKARPAASTKGNVAVLPMIGSITYRADSIDESSGLVGVQRWGKKFDALVNDDSVKAIVIDIDSPGGSVDGVPELAAKIFNARSQKHIVAVANTMAASAAYWVGSAADEFVVVPSGVVGSIGVYTVHQNIEKMLEEKGIEISIIKAGKFKAEGNPFGALSDETKAHWQAEVDDIYKEFINTVALNRKTDAKNVKENFGQGRVVTAMQAKKAGMVDRVATLDEVVEKLVGNNQQNKIVTRAMAEAKLRLIENS